MERNFALCCLLNKLAFFYISFQSTYTGIFVLDLSVLHKSQEKKQLMRKSSDYKVRTFLFSNLILYILSNSNIQYTLQTWMEIINITIYRHCFFAHIAIFVQVEEYHALRTLNSKLNAWKPLSARPAATLTLLTSVCWTLINVL